MRKPPLALLLSFVLSSGLARAEKADLVVVSISYPNPKDVAPARLLGIDPGGLVMIHGQPNGLGWLAPLLQFFNWTNGCVALSNADMDAVWQAVEPGTPIRIDP